MAEETPDAEDRTEAASQQRLDKARLEGDVAVSRETVHLASFAGAALGLAMLGPPAGLALAEATRDLLAGQPRALDEVSFALLGAAAPAVLGITGLAAGAALAAGLLQTRFLLSLKGLAPQPGKLNPVAGAKRLFGPDGMGELGRALLKLGVVGAALWWGAGTFADLVTTFSADAHDLAGAIGVRLGSLLAAALAAGAGVAGADMLWVRLRYARRMRMSQQELKDEIKESEGDPHMRAHRRHAARKRSRRRTLTATAQATVLVTNPTHYAIALSYERGRDAAPRVVAKGVDALAAKMREIAQRNDIPIVPNPPLARALYRVDEDTPIPEEHFRAVAEIIAFVWRLRNPPPRS